MQQPNLQNIYTQYSPKLLGICRRYVQDIQTCEDIVQDSFITAINSVQNLKNKDSIFPWLQKIVVNNALQFLKKQKPMEDFALIQESISEMEIPDNQLQNNVLSYDFTQEEILESIDQLNYFQKTVFNLYYFEKLSHQDIANELSINVNTSKSHLLRAKKNVQKFLLEKITESNSKTKRKIGILLFFGLGNWMWAKNLQSKFENFTIQPTKKLQITDEQNLAKLNFKSAITNQQKGIITSTFFIICLLPLLYWWFQTKNNETKIETQKPIIVSKKEIPPTESNVIEDNEITEIVSPIAKEEQKSKSDLNREIIADKNQKTIKKDTTTAKKIIVVKKIIQRDTIFVERPID